MASNEVIEENFVPLSRLPEVVNQTVVQIHANPIHIDSPVNKEVDSDSETCEKSGRNEVEAKEDLLSMSFSSETPRPNQEDGKNRKRRNHKKNQIFFRQKMSER
ncbi:hypothetical protein JTB14_009339 [Gonioctena quinquepunctata]|nr:hypothetical protein JTB14_009339 [Gonioctena quinquepunctata]